MAKFRLGLIALLVVSSVALGATLVALPNGKAQPTSTPTPSASKVNFGKLTKFYSQQLNWSDCGDGFECTKLEVPLNYAKPAKDSIYLSVIRRKAPSNLSRGSLIVNPGGPGGSGLDYARAADNIMTPTLRKNFDVVGFDPRGIGKSNPIKCLTDKQLDVLLAADQTPDNQSEVNQLVSLSKQFGAGCEKKSPQIMRFMDTISAAKDIDILRQALGDEKLNWFGKSYGTFLGATYAQLFPKRVGRMMLDGAMDPKLNLEQLSYDQALGFEKALQRFLADCAVEDDCPLSKNLKVATKQITNMFAGLNQKPARLEDGRDFTEAMALTGVLGSLYDKQYGWPDLRSALLTALEGDYTSLAASADFYVSRDSNGHYTDNGNEAIYAVTCLDRPDRATVTKTESLATKWAKSAPVFGAALAWSNLGCTYWPVPATGKLGAIEAKGSAKILVIGTKYDPATPYAWAKSLAKQLQNSELLTFVGDGHTAYLQGSDCVDEYVDQYFLIGRAPSGTVCTDGP